MYLIFIPVKHDKQKVGRQYTVKCNFFNGHMTPKPQYYMNETCFSSALNSKRIILQLSMFYQQKRSLGYK